MKKVIAYRRLLVAVLLSSVLAGCQTNPAQPDRPESTQLAEQIELANRLLAQGKHEAALAEYHLALELDPRNAFVLTRMAYLYDRLGDPAATEYVLRDLLAVEPDHAEALERLGLLELKRGQRAAAEEKFARAETLGRSSWRLFNGLGVLADYDGEYVAAQAHYARALQQQPTNRSLVLNNIGYSHYLAGDLQKALTFFNQALAIDPNFEQALSNKGLMLVRMERSDDAYSVFKGFMSDEKAMNSVGYLNMLLRDYRLAERYFRMAIKTSPMYYEEAHENLDRVVQLQRTSSGSDTPS